MNLDIKGTVKYIALRLIKNKLPLITNPYIIIQYCTIKNLLFNSVSLYKATLRHVLKIVQGLDYTQLSVELGR